MRFSKLVLAGLRFFSLSLASFVLNFGLTVLLHEVADFPEELAFAIGIVVVFIFNFIMMRLFVFRRSGAGWKTQFSASVMAAVVFRGAEYALFLAGHTWFGLDYRIVILVILLISTLAKFFVYRHLFESAFVRAQGSPKHSESS